MGSSQLASIFGGAVGTIMGSIAADNKQLGISNLYTWRSTLLFPAGGFLKIAFTWLFIGNEALDTQAREKEAQAKLQELDLLSDDQTISHNHREPTLYEQIPLFKDLATLLTNPVYLLTMFAMTTLQFGAGGL